MNSAIHGRKSLTSSKLFFLIAAYRNMQRSHSPRPHRHTLKYHIQRTPPPTITVEATNQSLLLSRAPQKTGRTPDWSVSLYPRFLEKYLTCVLQNVPLRRIITNGPGLLQAIVGVGDVFRLRQPSHQFIMI